MSNSMKDEVTPRDSENQSRSDLSDYEDYMRMGRDLSSPDDLNVKCIEDLRREFKKALEEWDEAERREKETKANLNELGKRYSHLSEQYAKAITDLNEMENQRDKALNDIEMIETQRKALTVSMAVAATQLGQITGTELLGSLDEILDAIAGRLDESIAKHKEKE